MQRNKILKKICKRLPIRRFVYSKPACPDFIAFTAQDILGHRDITLETLLQ